MSPEGAEVGEVEHVVDEVRPTILLELLGGFGGPSWHGRDGSPPIPTS